MILRSRGQRLSKTRHFWGEMLGNLCCSVISRCSRHHLHMFQFEFVIKWGGKASGNTHRKTNPKSHENSRKVTFQKCAFTSKEKMKAKHRGSTRRSTHKKSRKVTKSHEKSRKSLKVTETSAGKVPTILKNHYNKERNCIRFRSEGLCSR